MYLITGSAGFIGFHLCLNLLKQNKSVIGIDNINNYYDTKLKKDRLKILKKHKKFIFFKYDITNKIKIDEVFKKNKIKYVINLAAQAGVRYSIKYPQKYIDSNINGFFNILDAAKKNSIKHFLYASTSSVYGLDKKFPLSEEFGSNHPIQLYAATKKANELFAHAYSSLYDLPTTGLRFFTVYGPWGRPDMALFKFTKNILEGKKIMLFNKGDHIRDFTYVDDIVYGIISLLKKIPKKNKKLINKKLLKNNQSPFKFRVVNIGGNNPIKLSKYVSCIEKELKKKSKKKLLPLQPGDIYKTHANNSNLKKIIKGNNVTKVEDGIKKFINWYKEYYRK